MRSQIVVLVTLQVVLNGAELRKSLWNRTNFPMAFRWVAEGNSTTPNNLILTNHSAVFTRTTEEMAKSCLEDPDDCLEQDLHHESTTNHLRKYIFGQTNGPFDLSEHENVSLQCRRESKKFIEDLRDFKLWALKMHDSTAKIPSGLLNGNVNQLGDFTQCLKTNSRRHGIKGQYCLAGLQVTTTRTSSPYVAALHRLVQSHFHFRSELDDPGHRVPRFSSMQWALCVPSGCTSRDVELGILRDLRELVADTDIEVQVQIESGMCQNGERKPVPVSTIVAGGVFGGVLLVVVLAAVYDSFDGSNRWIRAFSLRKNWMSLISTTKSGDEVEAIHAIRFLNAFLLVLSHKSMAVFFVPYMNRTEMVEYVARPWTVITRTACLYTDSFILISGALTAYSFFGKLLKNRKINILEEYASRLMRIVPTYAALIAFCTFILPWLNNGPMWNTVITHHSDICKQHWWRNLLFIQNYFGFRDMCLTHTHHVGSDTQLFFLSPLLVFLIWKWPRRGSLTVAMLAAISTLMRYHVTTTMKLSNYIHFGTSIKQLFDTADYMYILPSHRLTVYIIGIFLGYILRKYKDISLTGLHLGNTAALVSFLVAFLGPAQMGSLSYNFDQSDAAWYAAFTPILWCFAISWLVFIAQNGHHGAILDRVFTFWAFRIWSKISYTVYLTQFPIFFYNVGLLQSTSHFKSIGAVLDVQEWMMILTASVVLTLAVEMPFQNIRNVIFDKRAVGAIKTDNHKVKSS